jgi:hypothetical protein
MDDTMERANGKIVYEVGEELEIDGVKCVCVESTYEQKQGRCHVNGKICVLSKREPCECFRYACLDTERPDRKEVVFIRK